MQFKKWLVSEMGKKKSYMPSVKKGDDEPMIIKGANIKTATGHEANLPSFRTGTHDSRPKRQKTRYSVNQRAIKDSKS